MASLTNTDLVRNAAVTLAFQNGAATQDIALDDADERFLLVVRNDDAATATIRAAVGDWPSAVLGDLSKDVAQDAYAVLGPFEGARFKTEDSKIAVAIVDSDGSSFSGTVTNVKLAVLHLP